MKVETHFCDLCSNTLNSKRHVVVIVHDEEFKKEKVSYGSNSERDVYEICGGCLFIMQELFKYKTSKVLKLKEIVDNMYKNFEGRENGEKV